jgi:hypothetical protein
MRIPRKWRVPAVIAAAVVVATAGGTPFVLSAMDDDKPAAVTPAAGAPTTGASPGTPSASPSNNPLDTPRGKFRANVAVTLTCVGGKPELKQWLLVDAPQSSVAQAVTTTEPQALSDGCMALFQPTKDTEYIVFRKGAGSRLPGWGAAGGTDHWHSTARDTYLLADPYGRATLVVLSAPTLPTGVKLAYHSSEYAHSDYFGAPTVIPLPPRS